MQHYRKTSHATYDCKCHIVWITEYRKPVMVELVGERVCELIREIYRENDVEILKGCATPQKPDSLAGLVK